MKYIIAIIIIGLQVFTIMKISEYNTLLYDYKKSQKKIEFLQDINDNFRRNNPDWDLLDARLEYKNK